MSCRLWLWSLLTGSKQKALLLEGRRLLAAKQHAAALEVFRQVVGEWPLEPIGYLGAAEVYRAMGLRLEAGREIAIGEALERLESEPGDIATRMSLAQALLEKEMYGWAAAHVDHALKQDPKNPEVARLAARIFTRNHNYLKAAEALRLAIGHDPLDGELYQQLAENLTAAKRGIEAAKAKAFAESIRSVEQNPESPQVVGRAVRTFHASGHTQLALKLTERFLENNAQDTVVLRLHGEVLMDSLNTKEAIQSLGKAVDLDPTDIHGHQLLAKAYKAVGYERRAQSHQDLAQRMAGALSESDPLEGEVVMVQVLLKSGQLDRARERAEDIATRGARHWRAPFVKGLLAKASQKPKEAMAFFIESCKMQPESPEPYLEIALLHSEAGQAMEAIGKGRQAVNLARRNPEVRRTLAKILRAHNYMDQAIEEEDLADSLAAKEREPREPEFP